MEEYHKINVRIGGMTYNLVSGESEQYTRQIAARADEMIRRVTMASPQLSQQMTTVLALVNAIDELTRQAAHITLAEQQREAAELKNTELRAELGKSRELNWEMKKEILRLTSLVHDLEKQLPAHMEPVARFHKGTTLAAMTDATVAAALNPAATLPATATVPADADVHVTTSVPAAAGVPAATDVPAATPGPDSPDLVIHAPGGWFPPERPRPLAQLRQTGLDEYLSLSGLPHSTVESIRSDDEP